MITPAEHEARNQRFAKILLDEVNRMNSASTPSGGGEITPAAADRATSLALNSGEAAAVAPPKPDESPAAAGADDWQRVPRASFPPFAPTVKESLTVGPDHQINGDDDTDEHAFPRARRIVCSASSDGQFTIHRPGSVGITLTAHEVRTVFEFLEDAQPIFERIAK